jgi:hypothetical protein
MIRRLFIAALLSLAGGAHAHDLGISLHLGDVAAQSGKKVSLPSGGGLAPGFPGLTPGWTATTATLTTGGAGDPTGGSNTATLTEDSTASANHYIISTGFSITGNATYTLECLIKSGTSGTRNVQLVLSDSGFANFFATVFNPATGAIVATTNQSSGAQSADGTASAGSGWYKVWITGAVNAGVTTAFAAVFLASGSSNSYSGDGVSNDRLWGCNVVAGSIPP